MEKATEYKLVFQNWKRPERDGWPEDGDECIVILRAYDGSLNVYYGGYYEDSHSFWGNWGLGGCVLEAESVVVWQLFEEYTLEMAE